MSLYCVPNFTLPVPTLGRPLPSPLSPLFDVTLPHITCHHRPVCATRTVSRRAPPRESPLARCVLLLCYVPFALLPLSLSLLLGCFPWVLMGTDRSVFMFCGKPNSQGRARPQGRIILWHPYLRSWFCISYSVLHILGSRRDRSILIQSDRLVWFGGTLISFSLVYLCFVSCFF